VKTPRVSSNEIGVFKTRLVMMNADAEGVAVFDEVIVDEPVDVAVFVEVGVTAIAVHSKEYELPLPDESVTEIK
jgi:methyl coenzyme M reductase subunit C